MSKHPNCKDPNCDLCRRERSPEQLRAEVKVLCEKIIERVTQNPQKAAVLLKLWIDSSAKVSPQKKAS